MPLTEDDRRRYFRIEDTLGVTYEPLTEAEAAQKILELRNPDPNDMGRLHLVERQLQLLIDKLRIQSPEVAEAIELLNIKFNTLKENKLVDADPARRRTYIRKVNLSACGMSLDSNERLAAGEKLYIDLTLFPTDLHIYTLADVIECFPAQDPDWKYTIRMDFYGMSPGDEELLVQHMVKRQARLLHEERVR